MCCLAHRILVFWQIFVAADALWGGYVTTSLHWIFVVSHLLALAAPKVSEAPAASRELTA